MVIVEWLLAVFYLMVGLNDLFLDLVFYCGPLRRMLAQGRENPVAKPEELEGIPEQPIAILIPAWDESAVIGAMLESTCARLDYTNYDIFVGTYPNDEATQMEVARAAFDRERIHRVVCPSNGPTSKADCLNWIVEAIKRKEEETGKHYAIFTLNDAEDVVHPLTLKLFNRFVPEYDMVQVPVVPFERYMHKLTGGTYVDEFAEAHLKNLDTRLAVGGMVPSAGVGTAFGREACDELAAQTDGLLFPPVSLTEDYDFSMRLFRNGRKSGLAKVWTVNRENPKNVYRELVAIKEFFPEKFQKAVRQKQRWMLGIAFQGWEKLGWGNGWRERYMLFRDRVGVLTSLVNAVTLLVLVFWADAVMEALLHHQVWNARLGRFHLPGVLASLIAINAGLVCHRMMQRMLFVTKIARRRQITMVPLRMLWGGFIDFYCALHAVRRYVHSRVTGKPLKWLKTAHEFPNVEQLLRTHRPLGDLLLEKRLISPDQLSNALQRQRRQGTSRKPLGEILVSDVAISEEQLVDTLTLQARSMVRVQEAAEAELADLPIQARREERPSVIALAALQDEARIPEWIREPVQRPARRRPVRLEEAVEVVEAPVELPVAEAVVAPVEMVEIAPMETAAAPPEPPAEPLAEPVQAFDEAPRYEPEPETPRLAPVIPISQPHRSIHDNADDKSKSGSRRFTVLQQVVAKWKTPFPSKRILVAIGTRREAVKLAPLVRELQTRVGLQDGPERVFVCSMGQDEDVVEEALATFDVDVDLNLNLMMRGQTLAGVSSRVLSQFAAVIEEFGPDWVVVQGDTATTAMASLAAFYAGVPVAHVEAGLRIGDMRQTFPEELNRRMAGMVADIHFAPTVDAKQNLLREGVNENDIVVTGNTGIDALVSNCVRLELQPDRPRARHSGPVRVLVTARGGESAEDGIANICAAIANLVRREPGRYVFLWLLDTDPRVGEIAHRYLGGMREVLLTGPVENDELLEYLDESDVVLTDSGELQEEAPTFGKPVLMLRETTERPESLRAGMAWLVGTDRARIETAIEQLAQQIAENRTLRMGFNPYGDGLASIRIADFFAGLPVKEFGEPEQSEELPRRMPVRAHERERLQTVS